MNWTLIPTRRRRVDAGNELVPFDSWFRDFFDDYGRLPAALETRLPRADVAETDKDFLVTLELPGVEENEVDVKLSGNQLIVSGERKQKKEDKDKHFHRVETFYGAFERRFELPMDVRQEPADVKATFRKGLLEIRIPKVEPRPIAKIPVKAG
jgi:HSP20 family protein